MLEPLGFRLGLEPIEEWLQERCEVGSGWTSATTAHESFVAWSTGLKRTMVMTRSKFGRRLKCLLVGGEGTAWKKDGVIKYALKILPEPDIGAHGPDSGRHWTSRN